VPSSQFSGLLLTKLILPSLPSSILPRGPLLDRLDRVLEHELTLLSAPAGFGKTTLMRSWVAQHQERCAMAWLALDMGDNDPVRFWRYVTMACQRFEVASDSSTPPLGSLTLEFLRHAQGLSLTGPQYLSFEMALTGLINDLAHLSQPGVLVLEDYHVIAEASIHETMATLIAHLPPMIHVVLLSRSDLPLPLARLRAQGELMELRASDLRFTLAETRLFLQQSLPFSLIRGDDCASSGTYRGLDCWIKAGSSSSPGAFQRAATHALSGNVQRALPSYS
jgi:LuxR family maltose regulon positive regulatory protein